MTHPIKMMTVLLIPSLPPRYYGCFPHVPGKELTIPATPGVSCLLPRNRWAYMWMATNDVLSESNSESIPVEKIKQGKGKLIGLSGTQILSTIRERFQTIIKATCPDGVC